MKRFQILRSSQKGVGLIEAMISVLVIGLALIVVTRSYVSSLTGLQHSKNLTVATNYMDEMAENIRANIDVADQYALGDTGGPDCASANCTAVEMAAYQIRTWNSEVQKHLYNHELKIGGIVDDTVQLTLFWDADRSGSSKSTNCPPVGANDKDCYPLIVGL